MFGLFRLVWRFVALAFLLVVLAIAGLVALFMHMDGVAKYLVESGTTSALGPESEADAVNVSLLRRNIRIDGLKVANTEGYEGPLLLEAVRIDGGVRMGTLLSDVVEVPMIEFDGLVLHIEQRGRANNFTPVLEHLQQRRDEEPRRRFHVDRVVIRNIDAEVAVVEQLGQLGRVTVHIPEIVLDDIGSDPERGVGVAEILHRVVPVVLAAVLEQGRDLPQQLRTVLSEDLGDVAADAGGELGRILGREIGRRLELEGVAEELLDRFLRRRDEPDD